jgi:protein tyrosine phosphatase (PTP) superfamily phosphohydrolase (DUF442 family)
VVAPPAAAAPAAVPPGGVIQGNYNPVPPAEPTPVTQDPAVRLSAPELSVPTPKQSTEPPLATPLPVQPVPITPEKREAPADSPIDIPQFKIVRANVATGQQPFPDGVTWLKNHGYRAVLNLRSAGTDDSAARRLFEKNGLRYLAIDVDVRTLSKETVDYFNRVVQDAANQPLFVYDADGSRTGGLWYLHFRLIEGWSNEKSLTEAARLGFRPDQDENHKTMAIAIQKLLEANGR